MDTKFRPIINSLLNRVNDEIGDQEGFYDSHMFSLLDRIYDGEAVTVAEVRTAIVLFRDKINNKGGAYPHPAGPLKVRHTININHWVEVALQALRKVQNPDYVPVLDRPAVRLDK